MSPSADPAPRHDDGFTLVEVIVAIGIATLVMVALLPQLVLGLRATGTAGTVTTAKGVVQAELERMRNLPFHVAPAAGGYVDVLDRYFPNVTPPAAAPACSDPASRTPAAWSGFVAATSTARCSFEPQTGAFFRTVRSTTTSRGPMVMVVATQFLTGATPPVPVTPRAGYDTAVNGHSLPASAQLGVTATVVHTARGVVRPVTTHTQLADQAVALTRLRAEARATALHVGSVTSDGRALTLTAGLVNAASSAGSTSTVTGNASAVAAGLATGEQGTGASRSVQAPPTQTIPVTGAPAGGIPEFGCTYACWSPSQLGSATLSAESGLPVAGNSSSPLQAGIVDTSTNGGLKFGTGSTTGYRPALDLTGPLVRLDASDPPLPAQFTGCAETASGVVTASGYLRATEGTGAAVESCAVARTTAVSLFPTGFAPQGVLRVRLEHASARCTAAASTGQAVHDYRALVEVWDGTGFTLAAEVFPGQTTDSLAAVPLATTSVGGGHVLGDYVASWSAATTGTVQTSQGPRAAEVSVPGVLTLATQPVRADATAPDGLDAASAVSLTLGAVSCMAEDAR